MMSEKIGWCGNRCGGSAFPGQILFAAACTLVPMHGVLPNARQAHLLAQFWEWTASSLSQVHQGCCLHPEARVALLELVRHGEVSTGTRLGSQSSEEAAMTLSSCEQALWSGPRRFGMQGLWP